MFSDTDDIVSDHRLISKRLAARVRAAFGALCIVAVAGALYGCNTTEGAGKDIEALGEGIQDAAD